MTPVDAPPRERLRRDLFPCDVTLEGDLFARGARVFITDTEALVYTANADRTIAGPTRIELIDPPATFRGLFIGRIDLETEAGTMHLNRAKGCGCHSPLKALPEPVAW